MIREATVEDCSRKAEIHVFAWRCAYQEFIAEDKISSLYMTDLDIYSFVSYRIGIFDENGELRLFKHSAAQERINESTKQLAEKLKRCNIFVLPGGFSGGDEPDGGPAAIECITSADGRILGKMGHCERWETGLYKNIPGEKHLLLFESGVRYFTG